MPLRSLIYVSSASLLFSQDDLLHLLQTSRVNNTRAGITGMLLYKGGNFMQAIEGEEGAIERLHAKIATDPRHHGVFTLLDRRLEHREFPGWSMGFPNLADPAVACLPGYSDFLHLPSHRGDQPVPSSQALKLLQVFRRQMR